MGRGRTRAPGATDVAIGTCARRAGSYGTSLSSITKMTKTEARLALAQRQRRFEWDLARDEQSRAAANLVAGKTHDLFNLVQIVQLASLELAKRCGDAGKEFIDDLLRSAEDATE